MKLNLNRLIWGAMALTLGCLLPACTLDEPDTTEDNNDETPSMRKLTEVSSHGRTMLKYEYSSGRLTAISGELMEDSKITVSYAPEMVITIDDWDSYDQTYTYRVVMSNIRMNSQGFITSLKATDYVYSDGQWVLDDEPVRTLKFSYDSHGRLQNYVDSDGTTCTWQWNAFGLLVSASDDDTTYSYEYGNMVNTHEQWSFDWGPLDVFMPTGWFGKGPAQYPVKITKDDGECVRYAYALDKDRYISSLKWTWYDDETVTFNFAYIK